MTFDFLLAGTIFALLLYTGGPCAQPFRDAAEMQAACTWLGVAHPPGYTLYTLVGHLWTSLLPCGNTGYRLNVLSTALMSIATVGLSAALRARGVMPLLAAGFAALAGLAQPVWTAATVSEPYALMAALATAALAAAARNRCGLAWLMTGLAICAHPMALVIVIPVALIPDARNVKCQPLTPFWVLMGVVPFLALPIRAKADPSLNWGRTETPAGLVQHLTRSEYEGLLLTGTRPMPPRQDGCGVLRRFAREFAADLTPPVAAAAVAGLALAVLWFPRQGWALAIGFLLAGPGYALAAALPGDPLSQATLLPGRILPVMFAILGAGLAAARIGRLAVTSVAAVAAACALLLIHGPVISRRWNFAAYDWAASLLRGVDRDGIALLAGDRNLFPVWAAQAGGARRDVDIVSPLLSRSWEVERLTRHGLLPPQSTVVTAMQDLVDRARNRRPVFVKHTVGALTRLDGAPSPTLVELRQRTAVRLPRPAAQDPYDRQIAEAMRW